MRSNFHGDCIYVAIRVAKGKVWTDNRHPAITKLTFEHKGSCEFNKFTLGKNEFIMSGGKLQKQENKNKT